MIETTCTALEEACQRWEPKQGESIEERIKFLVEIKLCRGSCTTRFLSQPWVTNRMFERIPPQEYKNSTSSSIFPGAHAVKQEQGTECFWNRHVMWKVQC